MSTTKDAVATMGGVLPDDAGGRDAVDVAVFSATCEQRVYPGQDVTLIKDGNDAVVSTIGTHIGIVDPFLKQPAHPGQRFWVFLYPRTVTGLCHRWTHPAFEHSDGFYAAPAQKIDSEQWLRKFLDSADCPGYDAVMNLLRDGHDGDITCSIDDEYMTIIGTDAGGPIPDVFWKHAENVTGRKFTQRPKYFSCSC